MLAKLKNRRLRQRRGQGMTEYIIIVGLIAILLVTAVQNFQGALQGAFEGATNVVNNDITGPIQARAGGGNPGPAPAPGSNP